MPPAVHTGYDNGRAITSGDVVSLLTGGNVLPAGLEWDSEWREHVLSYRERRAEGIQEHVATFPTLAFIQVRSFSKERVHVTPIDGSPAQPHPPAD